jgi:predicted nuclease of predicted toxin-antitoxin system
LKNLAGRATLSFVSGLALSKFKLEVAAVRDLGFRNAEDREIFDAARNADVVVVTKDRDFVDLVERYGPPPKVVWVTCGNTSNARMRNVLAKEFPIALGLLNGGESLVEITDLPGH